MEEDDYMQNKLKRLKERIERIINNKDVTLEEKRKYFNNWVIENNYFDDMDIVELQKFINVMATWYTLRYPSEVLESDSMPSTKIDKLLTNQNEYLDFVLKTTNNKLNMNYIDAIASQWKRSRIMTVEDAIKIARSENNKRKPKTKVAVEPTWFDQKIETTVASDEEKKDID